MVFTLVLSLNLLSQKTNTLPQATTNSYQNYVINDQDSQIKTTTDLDTQLRNLDNIDINQINNTLNSNEADALDL